MLKNLRRKFIVIIMALVSAVMVSVLGGTYASTYRTQHDITNEALKRGIEGELIDMPKMALGARDGDESSHLPEGPWHEDERRANMLVLSVDLDENGVVLATNNAPVDISTSTFEDILHTALTSSRDQGWDESLHLAWMRKHNDDDSWRVVIADTTAQDLSLSTLLMQDLVLTGLALIVLFLISLGLSTWVLKPVGVAWDQQRRFIADASHELKTPLAVIIANTQILSKSTGLSDDDRRWVDSTAEESAHMKGLVEELLELARADESAAGAQGVLQKTDVDFTAMVENAALEFDAIAFERGTQIREDVAQDIHVQGDPEWLGRLCKILIDNACKYADKGSKVSVTLSREGRKCALAVNNKGSVIDQEDLPHVFDRFYRTDKARSRDQHTGGFGLGLAIAKGIADAHGGSIAVASDADDGTTFTVTLTMA